MSDMTLTHCLICEKEVPDEKLSIHSIKCKESAELKEELHHLANKIEAHGERAEKMKTTLETHAAKTKIIRSKRLSASSRNLLDTSIRMKSPSDVRNALSPTIIKNLVTETDVSSNYEDEKIVDRTFDRTILGSTQETVETIEDSYKKKSEEDYAKFTDEAKKSMAALRIVIMCSKDIAKAPDSINDVGADTQHELEEYEKGIMDSNISDFLREYIEELEQYLEVKKKYFNSLQELLKINFPKHRMGISRSSSSRSVKPIRIPKYGPGDSGESTPTSIFGRKGDAPSPWGGQAVQRKSFVASPFDLRNVSTNPNTPDVTSPLPVKKELPKFSSVVNNTPEMNEQNLMSMLTSPSPSGRSMKINKNLLQTNINHVAGPSIFANAARKNNDEANMLREKINQTIKQNGTEKRPSGGNEIIMSTPSMPTLKKPRGRMTVTQNPFLGLQKTVSNHGPGEDTTSQEAKRSSSQNKVGKSVAWFKSMRNEDSAILSNKNTELSTRGSEESSPQMSPTIKVNNPSYSNVGVIIPMPAKLNNIISPEDFGLESPKVKGWHSEKIVARTTKLTRSASNEVSWDDFEIIKEIGKGAYGIVYLVKKKATGKMYAMKTVDFSDNDEEFIQKKLKGLMIEKEIYNKLKGSYFVKAIWTFHSDSLICFVMEYMLGGDFNSILDKVGILDQEQAQFYFAELVLALESLHNQKFVHRDLKPENILMDAEGHIKLTDFGLSRSFDKMIRQNSGRKNSTTPPGTPNNKSQSKTKADLSKVSKNDSKDNVEFKSREKKSETIFNCFDKSENYHTVRQKRHLLNKKNLHDSPGQGDKKPKKVGTPDYMAPEIINPDDFNLEGYDEKCMDWWSMGVILYQFLVGCPPFCDNTIDAVFDNIKHMRMEWPPIGEGEDCLHPVAHDLISKLLTRDPKKRLGAKGAQEVKDHPFFSGIEWDNIRTKEAPIIPYSMKDVDEKDNNTPISSINISRNPSDSSPSFSSMNNKALKRSSTIKPIELKGFIMRRLDVLEQQNQENARELIRQKSGKFTLGATKT